MIKTSLLFKDELKDETDCFSKVANLLLQDEEKYEFDIDEILVFLAKAGLILVPKIKSMITWALNKASAKEIIRMVVKGPRGGGKTYSIAAGIEFPLFYFFNYDCVNLGGSRAQADKAYEIIQELIKDPDIRKNIESSIKMRTKKKDGTWINVLATSGTSVRSPHAGNPSKGGLLFIDEECEIQEEGIVKSVKPVVNTARPSAIIRASTQHRLDDSFEDVWNNANEQGYTRFSWDIFDVCQKCTRKCNVNIKDDPVNGCYDALRKDSYDVNGSVVKRGYCKGRAHHDGWFYRCSKEGRWTKVYKSELSWREKIDGWVTMEEIFQALLENDSETFEVEWLGRRAKRRGKVYPSDKIDDAILTSFSLEQKTLKRLSKSIGVDWGYTNETCVVYAFHYNKKVYIYHIEYFVHADLDYIKNDIVERSKTNNHEEAYCDAEGAFENASLSDDLVIFSVAFSSWKDFGVKNFRNYLEKDSVHIIQNFNGRKNPGFDRFVKQLKNYRYDPQGNYLKKEDHGPDAGLCVLLKWARKRQDLKNKKDMINMGQPRMHLI